MKDVNWLSIMASRPDLKCEGLSYAKEYQLRQLLLDIVPGGRLSPPVFYGLCGLLTKAALEVVFYRLYEGRVEVLLKRRPADDPFYGGQLGVVGRTEVFSQVLPWEEGQSGLDSFNLVLRDALSEIGLRPGVLPTKPSMVDNRLFDGDRGPVHQTVCLWEVPTGIQILGVEWHPADKLPADIIGEHISLIKLAVSHI